MDLSNLLGIKKEKLIEILKSRSFAIQDLEENDLLISKKITIHKKKNVEKNKKILKTKQKKVKNTIPKKLFNNPFNQLKDINAK
jgi:hypothetical protein